MASSSSDRKVSTVAGKSVMLHAFSDLSRTLPLFFVHILKQSYIFGKGKAVVKFKALRHQVIEALPTAPPPGPATYIMHCLNVLRLVDAPYDEGLSHLLTSALSCLDKLKRTLNDDSEARKLAAELFNSVILGSVVLNERILVKLATVFKIEMKDLKEAAYTSILDSEKFEKVKTSLEAFILRLIRARLYPSAVALLKQFALQHTTPKEFLVTMTHDNQVEVAEQWAVYMGKDMICSLVQNLINKKMFKKAYKMVQKYKLKPEFPGVYYQYKKSSLRKLAGKGCWELAESMANDDRQLVECLVNVAHEKGDVEKAADLCRRYCIADCHAGSVKAMGATETHYLQLQDIVPEENVVWIDASDGLFDASRHFAEVKVVGIDCEWRPNYLKGKGPNKVSILQIATGRKVFIFDLIKLFETEKDALDDCLKLVFHSPNILKLGYALHNDLEQLFLSYEDLVSFHFCEATLDLQKLSGSSKGGLSGLAKTVLGGYLDKTRRMSNWDQRPLNHGQLHYAALDAAVLIAIFNALCCEPSSLGSITDWKSQISSCRTFLKHQRRPKIQNNNVDLMGKKLVDNQGNSIPSIDWNTEAIVASMSNTHIRRCSSPDRKCASEEELVYASCELLGLSTPGLLKSELQHYTQIADLTLPIYNTSKEAGPGGTILYCCTVAIGSMKFYGRPAHSKKEAEYWAALHALSYVLEGSGIHELISEAS